jgi:outer membrane protein TolC
MARPSVLFVLLVISWGSGVTSAQPPPAEVRLGDLVAEALASNPDLVTLKARHASAQLKPDTERFLMPPMAEGQAAEWPINTANPRNARWMAMLQQEIPGRGKRALRAEVMAREASVAGNDVDVKAREILAQLKQSFADYTLAVSSLTLYDDALAVLRQAADQAELKYAAGSGMQQDLHKTLLDMAGLYERKVMANEQARMAEARLNALVGRPPGTPLGRPAASDWPTSLPDSEALQRAALERHPELRGTALEAETARASVALARAERRPDFFVQGGYMAMPYMPDAVTVRVGVSWPGAPWARKRLEALERAAEADVEVARARQAAVANRVRLMVHEAFLKVKSAEERAALLRTSVLPQTEHTLEMTRLAYQNDRGDFMSFLDTQRLLLVMRLEYERSLADRDRALAELELAVGADLSDLVVPGTGPGLVLGR